MSCLTLLKLLDVCRWIFVFKLFLAIDTCCVKGWEVAHRIFARKEDGFTFFIVFISLVVCFSLHCFVFYHCLLVLYLFDSRLLFKFPFKKKIVNTSLQHPLVSFSFFTLFVLVWIVMFLSLSFCSLLVWFPLVVWVSVFLCFYKHFFATIHLYRVHFPHC
jgi:hypothetical protein